MKPGPVLAMVLLIFLGVWLVLQPALKRGERIDPLAHRFEMSLGAREVVVEQRVRAGDANLYHFKGWSGVDERGWIETPDFEKLIAEEMTRWESRPRWERMLMGFFNITSWFSFGWVLLGLVGQASFLGRMLVQWVRSEKEGASVVPSLFWWLSLFGGVLLFAYFVWRRDIVGVMGQSTGVVIYARNLRLIHKQHRRLRAIDAALRAESEKDE
jgi:lipid-A-disaccharide synthase-like uncharacterized protein